MVLFEKQVHLQNDEGSAVARHKQKFLGLGRGRAMRETYLRLILL